VGNKYLCYVSYHHTVNLRRLRARLFADYVSGFSVVSPNLQSCNANQG
jgi:hypothetical protein